MAVKIRLRRTGCNNCVSYRVVATDGRSPRDGKFLETLGWYDPKREGENYQLDVERVAYWQARGAQVSETVASLVRRLRRAPAKA
jgi:small subunit ribosomal protein S16